MHGRCVVACRALQLAGLKTIPDTDIAVIGGGIVGCATALSLSRRPGVRVTLLEAEPELACHQTGRNSGVIHSGLYYRPGSLKAATCRAGREALWRFCQEHGVPHERCGKLVVAQGPRELTALAALEERGRANGLVGLRRLPAGELRELEPHAQGDAGLWVPETGIADFAEVARACAREAEAAGGRVLTRARLLGVRQEAGGLVLLSSAGEVRARLAVNCAGLQCDRVARLFGVEPGVRIVPFRGEYFDLVPSRRHLVRNLIYPVPDPRLPFLGVHLTRTIHGAAHAGPNAVLAWRREGYSRWSFSPRDAWEVLVFRGTWRMLRRHWRAGLEELWRSWVRAAFVRDVRRLVPEVETSDLTRGGCGVRAQAVAPDGALLDDFHLLEAPGSVHVLNAPSPAATASLAIGEAVARRALGQLGL